MMEQKNKWTLGVDVGSTTVKLVLQQGGETRFEKYERHYSRVRQKTAEILEEIRDIVGENRFACVISGSAGLGLSQAVGIRFAQEVFATGEVVKKLEPDASCVIELGGEDAKIIFFDGGLDERMNGSCAGGTGAFIDQMATLLDMTVDELDQESLKHRRIYPIASRCGVFAKSDIQPLINQGATKADIAASIYQAVVNQTIAGLARGRKIQGKVLFLGGPLYFLQGLRDRFCEVLHLSREDAVFPEYGRFAVAMGAAMLAEEDAAEYTVDGLISAIRCAKSMRSADRLPPLFDSPEAYQSFVSRHARDTVPTRDTASYSGKAYLGIDCGSTTTKLVLISQEKEILYSCYTLNHGNPMEIVHRELEKIYAQAGTRIQICGSAVTGYGEELIRNAFGVDRGVVETLAHYRAARHYMPDVNFILDIGGQDIKCFGIRNGAIESIMLNEACSSGCGSFLGTFAESMGLSIAQFAQKGLFGKAPVNLGSRCTVFMNSSVKQAQKEGATIEDISAGLSVSVVKNALYKVIRCANADELGEKIVVQGGTFLNDAVLRAFELEIGRNVVRPDIAGLMGAFGAALGVMDMEHSGILPPEDLAKFSYTSKATVCNGCANHCHLTVNTFAGGRRFIAGNQCQRGLGVQDADDSTPNLYQFKREYLTGLPAGAGNRGKIGLPLALGIYELLPLWHGILTALGFSVVVSGLSSRATYEKGQFSIPSDTVCYPAKIMHGHVESLLEQNVDAIFAPCLTRNVNERSGDNHFNCPVVAYYPELLSGNMESLRNTRFLYPYLNIDSAAELARELHACLGRLYGISMREIMHAVKHGMAAYKAYRLAIRREGERALDYAREHGKRVMILAGRPYHIDPEICHGIDKLAVSLGFVVVSEDSVCHLAAPQQVSVLNQWTYHSRLYRAARYAARHSDVELVQLVSFGCGVDAITTDEVRAILESGDKYYTQIKIDEISNLGAVKIRLRSLLGALEEKERGK